MGVYNFFWNWLRQDHPQCMTFLSSDYTTPSPDMFLIDGNSVFHGIWAKTFSENPSATHADVQKNICHHLYSLLQLVNPLHTVYISIDGVAGCCKQSQQRKRRFDPTREDTIPYLDTIHITAGTQFMTDLCNTIRQYFANLLTLTVTLIFDDMFVPGEGEHKLIHHIRTDLSHSSYMVYSPDADLMMLTLILHKPNITVLRINDFQHKPKPRDPKYHHFLVHIDRLSTTLSLQYRWPSTGSKQPFVKSNFLVDIVMMMFILGNDFLPHIDHIKIPTGGIEMIIQLYRRVIPHTGFLVNQDTYQLNTRAMIGVMSLFAKLEPELLLRKYKLCQQKRCFPNPILERAVTTDDTATAAAGSSPLVLDFDQYRRDYYQKTKMESADECCREYYRGMSFVIQYYIKSVPPTYDWYYTYYYPPLFRDLYAYAMHHDLTFTFAYQPPLTLYEALFSIIPPRKAFVLPEFLQPKMSVLSRTDPEFSETEVRLDLEGKDEEYKAIILVPTVSYTKIKRLLAEFHLKDPPAKVYTITRRLAPSRLETHALKYTITISAKIEPRSTKAGSGLVLSIPSKKIMEYGKFVPVASNADQLLHSTLNDAFSWMIRKFGQAVRRGTTIRVLSDQAHWIRTVRTRHQTEAERQTQILLERFLRPSGYKVEFELIDPSRILEAREMVEDVLLQESDLLRTFNTPNS